MTAGILIDAACFWAESGLTGFRLIRPQAAVDPVFEQQVLRVPQA